MAKNIVLCTDAPGTDPVKTRTAIGCRTSPVLLKFFSNLRRGPNTALFE